MTFDSFDRTHRHSRPEPTIDTLQSAGHAACLVVPRGVKKAMDFIDANLGAPITVADLMAASSLPGRTLFKHFRDFVGMSPMAYLRARRLQRIRRDLQRGDADSVTNAALQWGFTHLGRFAGEYFRMCGELPSTTLKLARQRQQS